MLQRRQTLSRSDLQVHGLVLKQEQSVLFVELKLGFVAKVEGEGECRLMFFQIPFLSE